MTKDNLEIPQIKLEEDTQVLESRKASVAEPEGLTQIRPKTTDDEVSEPELKRHWFKITKFNFKRKKLAGSMIGVLALVCLVLAVILVLPGIRVYNDAKILQADAADVQAAIASQDMSRIKSKLTDVKTHLVTFQSSYQALAWTRFVPIVGVYWTDGQSGVKAGLEGLGAGEILIETVEPYADIIGFTTDPSKQASSGEESANDRIEFLIQTIQDISPKMDIITQKAKNVHDELAKIDPDRYPEEFRGIKVREKLSNILQLAEEGTQMLADSKPLIEAAPYLLGIDDTRTYLLLFQNDKELRPTGGFLTAYSLVNVSKGKLQPVSSSDIYALDAKYKRTVPVPEPMAQYLGGEYAISKTIFLRDMNWSPDFKASMDLFYSEASKAGIPQVDGIIAVDTHVVVKILDVLGEIGVPGFGNFSTKKDPRCDCPQVIYELESFADVEGPVVWSENEPGKIVFAPANYGKNRKEIVGPLMNSVLSNALGQPKEKLPELFQAGWEAVTEKHVLVYMNDQTSQAAVEGFNIAGRMQDFEGDYLHINNANLGGRKSNLYVTHEVVQEYTVQNDGSIEKTLTITYKNPKEYDGWLNSVLPNWTRVYVPKGSQLISTEGFEDKYDPYEELGKTVFSGGFKLRPQGVNKVVIRYKLPFKRTDNLKLLIQKQPGLDNPIYTNLIGKKKEDFFLKTDKESRIRL